MAARQGTQSNAMLYSLITFVALFIIATVCAVIFYVKSEEYRTNAQDDRAMLDEVARAEKNKLTKVVGKPEKGKSYLGTMEMLVDDLYKTILGKEVPADTPATVKFNEISMATVATLENLGEDANPALGTSGALLNTIDDLKQKLETLRGERDGLKDLTADLEVQLQDAGDQIEQQQARYKADLSQFQAMVDETRNRYDDLKRTWEQATDDQKQDYENKLETAKETLKAKQLDLQETEKKLAETDDLLDSALVKLEEIKPKPNIETQAFKPDARIVRIDLQNGIVYLNVGTKNRIYRGLTFAIYDSNRPIPESGQGKAEIEIFQVNEQASAARILKSDTKNPIVKEDIVSNLIWDSQSSNRFVVAGEFDMNNDGRPEADGRQQITEMVERWGGRLMDDVTVDTDFIIIGLAPKPMPRPSQEDIDIDPMAQQRYEMSQQKIRAYNTLLQMANDLNVPVFNQKRFMYLIGYDTLANKNQSF